MGKNKSKKLLPPSVEINIRDIVSSAVFLAITTFIAYSVALKGTWALDDVVINRGVTINDLSELLGFRKVAYLTFLINEKIGGFSPVSYRVFNILIHILNSILIFFLSVWTLGDRQETKLPAFSLSLMAATVFALHPVNVNAVSYIVQRMASLSALFVLLALHSYRYAVRSTSRELVGVFGYFLCFVFIMLGVFSKENAVVVIPLIPLYDRYFLVPISGDKKSFYRRMTAFLVIGCISLLIASAYLNFGRVARELAEVVFGNFTDPLQAKRWMASDVYWSPLEHILTEFRVINRYLMIILIPFPGFYIFDWWGYPLSKSLTVPAMTLPAIFVICGLLIFGFFSRKKYPFLSFGIFWYMTAISLESFIAIGSDLYFEHRNYLPAAGLFFGVVAQAGASLVKQPSRKMGWIAVGIVAVLLGSATFERNRIFTDSVSLWSDTVKKAPENLRATVALGNAYLKKSNLSEAENYYRKVMKEGYRHKRAGFFIDASYSLGMIYLFQSRTDKAKTVIDMIEEASEGSYEIKVLRAFYLARTGEEDEAAERLQQLLRRGDEHYRTLIYTLLGDIYKGKKDLYGAELNYNNALSIDPTYSAAYYGLAKVRLLQRDLDRAEELLRKAHSVDPDNVLVLSDLSDVQLMKKDGQEALLFAQKAIQLKPDFPDPYLSMGNVLTYLGRNDEADRYYREAEKRGLSGVMALFSKSRSLMLKGDRVSARALLNEILKRNDTPEYLREIIRKETGNL